MVARAETRVACQARVGHSDLVRHDPALNRPGGTGPHSDARGQHNEQRRCRALTPDIIAAFVAGGAARTSQASTIYLHHFHGAAARVGVTDTAFATRTRHFVVEILAAWDSGDASQHIDWAQALYDDLAPHALPGGYPNPIGPGQSVQADHAYGPNAQRLLADNATWDGAGMFSATPLPT